MEILLLRKEYLVATRGFCLKSQKINKAKTAKILAWPPKYTLKNNKCPPGRICTIYVGKCCFFFLRFLPHI